MIIKINDDKDSTKTLFEAIIRNHYPNYSYLNSSTIAVDTINSYNPRTRIGFNKVYDIFHKHTHPDCNGQTLRNYYNYDSYLLLEDLALKYFHQNLSSLKENFLIGFYLKIKLKNLELTPQKIKSLPKDHFELLIKYVKDKKIYNTIMQLN